ncbi:hypothetical protein O988_04397 [Pseudogymnoascus sp. VKM F-3808]|nr:hypothetical protein O988_04397 [Pseudogymnoascus sp. VKM F-3808]
MTTTLLKPIPKKPILLQIDQSGSHAGLGTGARVRPRLSLCLAQGHAQDDAGSKGIVHSDIHKHNESGASLARYAISDKLAEVSGKYFEGEKEIKSSVPSYDEKKWDNLWEWTVKYCAQDETEAARFNAFSWNEAGRREREGRGQGRESRRTEERGVGFHYLPPSLDIIKRLYPYMMERAILNDPVIAVVCNFCFLISINNAIILLPNHHRRKFATLLRVHIPLLTEDA